MHSNRHSPDRNADRIKPVRGGGSVLVPIEALMPAISQAMLISV